MSDDNVTQFPTSTPAEFLVGPFSEWRVQIEGRMIPRLTAFKDGDKIGLVVDHRFSHSFAKDDAYQASWLLAQALAIGEGYPHLAANNKERPFASLGMSIEAPKP